MATERLPMRRIREILRMRRQQGLSVRETARALGVSVGVVLLAACVEGLCVGVTSPWE